MRFMICHGSAFSTTLCDIQVEEGCNKQLQSMKSWLHSIKYWPRILDAKSMIAERSFSLDCEPFENLKRFVYSAVS